jgi:hypothetical protein
MLDNIYELYILSIERRKIMNYKFKTKPYAHQITALENLGIKKLCIFYGNGYR